MSPRSWKHREFAVTQAGYFTVLKPTGWSSATLPPGSRYLNDPSKDGAAPSPDQTAPDCAGSQETTISLKFVDPPPQNRHSIRLTLIALAAAALTVLAFWWMTRPWVE
ncbi:MAG: hypothetical protein WCF30_14830 [Terracidiphilus sp.]